jgi:hypothetical protein
MPKEQKGHLLVYSIDKEEEEEKEEIRTCNRLSCGKENKWENGSWKQNGIATWVQIKVPSLHQ